LAPGGPPSSLACATTSGAVCACDAEVASCVAVKAVVASSRMRSFVMMSLVPGIGLTAANGPHWHVRWSIERLIIRPDCGGLQMVGRFLFHWRNGLHSTLFIARSGDGVHPAALSVAGFGVVGLFGPRVGNSSGVLPGNSCGCDGSPGSRTGGGISGLGLPGGFSSGGSVGCPGVAGGISGGSIGITSPESRVDTPSTATTTPARSSRRRLAEGTNYAGAWQTASILWPSGSSTKAP
jgi:hypothetical protein